MVGVGNECHKWLFNPQANAFQLNSVSESLNYLVNRSTLILSSVSKFSEFEKHSEWNLTEPKISDSYSHYDALSDRLRALHNSFPSITHLYSVGSSVQGRMLWAISIGDNPDIHELGEAEVKLIGNIHGDEPMGKEILLLFASLLCLNYGQNPMITALLDNTQIHILPSMNPDGFEISKKGEETLVGRGNHHQVDLNRNFPDQFNRSLTSFLPEPETASVIRWSRLYPFVLSASLHGGALVAVYPYDGSFDHTVHYSSSPDDATFRDLALSYSKFLSAISPPPPILTYILHRQ
ncbi:unnamed protein product [Calicophoron daubneyi]|uniref:Peptidase M14 domain-containing protein n=1 Tax=Calicophoron daubneyi TaxID=300641 RepID=A0AAV2TEE3_CALDB